MNLIFLPINLIKFWYPEALFFWLRTLKNTLLYLEEDLAVGLMWKLLFVPLFHDSTIVGRILSFLFRLTRIIVGLTAFLVASIFIFILSVFWFLIPILALFIPGQYGLSIQMLLLSGVLLFIYHKLSHPPKKLWHLKLKTGADSDLEKIWQCSTISKDDFNFSKLLKKREVRQLLVYLEQDPQNFANLSPLPEKNALLKTVEIGASLGLPYLGPEHFFTGLLSEVPEINKHLLKLGLKYEDFLEALDYFKKRGDLWRMSLIFDEDFSIRHLKGVNRGWLGVPTPVLDSVGEDLTQKAAKISVPDFLGRLEIVHRVIDTLSLVHGRNVLIVGEAGSGKTALVEYLAKLIVKGDAPSTFATKRLVRLDLTRLLAGVKSQGDLAEKIENVFEEIKYSENIILFIDEIENLGIGEAGTSYNLYSLMLPFIESDKFQFIATIDPVFYTKVLEKDRGLARLFTKIELPPASFSETLQVIKRRAIRAEQYRKIKFSLLAQRKIVEITSEYVHDRVLPDASIQVFEECLIKAKDGFVKQDLVEEILQDRIKIPIGSLKQEQKNQLINLESLIHKKMVNQEEAVEAVAKTLRRAAVNLREKGRPIGSFLFVGPTGVGKTELSKILAEVYFQGRGQFFRLDMSEYQTKESVDKLIGKTSEEGYLTEFIRLNPYCLILLDEFEKAYQQILTIFLQVLEDGRLTDGTGRTVDFTNTIIIATSNVGSLTIASGLDKGLSFAGIKDQVQGELLNIFKPELINRFDEVVIFKPLTVSDLSKIVRLKLFVLQKQLEEQGYLVEFTDGLVETLTEKGFDKVLGARPLRRLIQDTLAARLSVMILENKLPKGERFVAGEELLN